MVSKSMRELHEEALELEKTMSHAARARQAASQPTGTSGTVPATDEAGREPAPTGPDRAIRPGDQ